MDQAPPSTEKAPVRALQLWIDAVGAFLLWLPETLVLGQYGSADCDLGLFANLNGQIVRLERGGEGVVLAAAAALDVNGRMGKSFLLRHGDLIVWNNVRIRYERPIAWSATSLLRIAGRRFPISYDAIVLLGESCVLGSAATAHIAVPWRSPVHLARSGSVADAADRPLSVRLDGEVCINGERRMGGGPLAAPSNVRASFGAFRVEAAS